MSFYSSDVDWCSPDAWAAGDNSMAEQAPNVPEALNESSYLSMYGEQSFETFDSAFFNYATVPSSALLSPTGYKMPCRVLPDRPSGLDWMANDIAFEFIPENSRPTPRSSQIDTHVLVDPSSMHPSIGQSGRAPRASVTEATISSQEQSAQPILSEASENCDGAHDDRAIKCQWKGCTYAGIFSRKAELKRHVETQHISPRSYECAEPKCKKAFNRKDNLGEHFRRAHVWDV